MISNVWDDKYCFVGAGCMLLVASCLLTYTKPLESDFKYQSPITHHSSLITYLQPNKLNNMSGYKELEIYEQESQLRRSTESVQDQLCGKQLANLNKE